MTKGDPAKLILRFAFPIIITNLGQQFYMITDAAIVGRGVGVRHWQQLDVRTGHTGLCFGVFLP